MKRQKGQYACVRNYKKKSDSGYTWEEAGVIKGKVDTAHGVENAHSKWHEAEIVEDPRGGYMVRAKRI